MCSSDLGPEWVLASRVSQLMGAPIPEHVVELMHRGRLADGSHLTTALGIEPRLSTPQVIDHLYQWETVVRVPSRAARAVA